MRLHSCRVLVVGFVVAALAVCEMPAPADTLVLRNGQRQTGVVEDDERDPAMLWITTTGGRFRIPRANIADLQRDTPANARLALGNAFFQIGQYENALEQYQIANQLEPNNEQILVRLAAAQARMSDRQAEADEAMRRTALELLEEARAAVAQERFPFALDKIRAAEVRAGSLIEAERIAALASLYEAWGRARFDRLDYAGSSQYLEMSLQYAPDNQSARDALLRALEQQPERRQEVLNHYKERLVADPHNVEIALKVVDLQYRLGQFDDMSVLLVDLARRGQLADVRYRRFLEEALIRATRTELDARRFEAAREKYLVLLEFFPDHDRQTLNYIDYYIRANQIDPNSYQDRVDLGKFAMAHGMYEEARQELSRALMIDSEGPEARQLLTGMAQGRLTEAQRLVDSATAENLDPAYAALTLAQQLQQEFPTLLDVVDQARVVSERADNLVREHMRARQRSAADIAMRGDEYYERALGYMSEYQRSDFTDRVRAYNPVTEAQLNLNRAINAWNTALQLDSSLASLEKGDLRTKIADAQRLLRSLQQPLPRTTEFREYTRQRQ